MVIIVAADDAVVTIDDDTGEASMMKMMGFSDFNSTKVSLCPLVLSVAGVMAAFVLSLTCALCSDGVKDTDGKAKAKDISHEVKTKAKDLTLKAKDTSHKAKDIQHKPKSLCHGDLSLWRDVMSESSCWHTRLVTKTHH